MVFQPRELRDHGEKGPDELFVFLLGRGRRPCGQEQVRVQAVMSALNLVGEEEGGSGFPRQSPDRLAILWGPFMNTRTEQSPPSGSASGRCIVATRSPGSS